MKRLAAALGFLLVVSVFAHCQTTTVSATVVDSDSTTWANGSWHVQFVPNPSQPNPASYTIGGTPLSAAVLNQSGVLDGSGAFSFSVYQTAPITPVGSSWLLYVCPNATSKCGTYNFTSVGSTQDLSSALTTVIPAPRFHPVSGQYGYADGEATLSLVPGSTYWNVSLGAQRCYTGSVWGACNSTSSAGVSSITPGTHATCTVFSGGKCVGDVTVNADTQGINQLNGDVTAGPGTGNQTATLKTVNSNVGACGDATNVAVVTLDAQGRSTACTATPITFPAGGITELTGDVTAGPGSGSQAATLKTVNSNVGTCGDASNVPVVVLDAQGRTTSCTPTPVVPGGTARTCNGNGCYTIAADGTIFEWVNTGSLPDNTPVTLTLPVSIPSVVLSITCTTNDSHVQGGNIRPVGANVAALSPAFTTFYVTATGTGASAYCEIVGY